MKRTENVTKVYDHFYRYQEITDILQAYVAEHPELASIESIGKTLEGRDIWVITVTDRKTGAPEDKPAFFTEGNIHAGEVTGCMTLISKLYINLFRSLLLNLKALCLNNISYISICLNYKINSSVALLNLL